jgi:hypothetical protein
MTRLDKGNAALYRLPAVLLRRLQSGHSAAARLIFDLRRTDHLTCSDLSLIGSVRQYACGLNWLCSHVERYMTVHHHILYIYGPFSLRVDTHAYTLREA